MRDACAVDSFAVSLRELSMADLLLSNCDEPAQEAEILLYTMATDSTRVKLEARMPAPPDSNWAKS